jgi:hypothetical protein
MKVVSVSTLIESTRPACASARSDLPDTDGFRGTSQNTL